MTALQGAYHLKVVRARLNESSTHSTGATVLDEEGPRLDVSERGRRDFRRVAVRGFSEPRAALLSDKGCLGRNRLG